MLASERAATGARPFELTLENALLQLLTRISATAA